MIKTGSRLVPKRGNSLSGFTAYKSYEVIAGTGEMNQSPIASKIHTMQAHSDTSCNVLDDNGKIRFVTLTYFSTFESQLGLF